MSDRALCLEARVRFEDERHRVACLRDDDDLAQVGERRKLRRHPLLHPLYLLGPHLAHDDEDAVLEVPDLQQLQDHGELEVGAEATRHNDEGTTAAESRELVQSREEVAVEVGAVEELIGLLDTVAEVVDTDSPRVGAGSVPLRLRRPATRRLHEAGSAAGHDVDALLGETPCETARLFVERIRVLDASATEYYRAEKPRFRQGGLELVHHAVEVEERALTRCEPHESEDLSRIGSRLGPILVREALPAPYNIIPHFTLRVFLVHHCHRGNGVASWHEI